MVKTEKHKDSVLAITNFCRYINRSIGNYQMHYLTEDHHFTVDVGNGTLKMPIILAAEFNNGINTETTDLILKVAFSFKPKNTKPKSYRKILQNWRNLFSDKPKN